MELDEVARRQANYAFVFSTECVRRWRDALSPEAQWLTVSALAAEVAAQFCPEHHDDMVENLRDFLHVKERMLERHELC